MTTKRLRIIAQTCAPDVPANRPLIDEPLTADDWQRIWHARQGFLATVRQVVCEARLREETQP